MTGYQIARLFQFVRETGGPNKGRWVGLFQSFCDGVAGDSWCSDFRSVVRSIQWQGQSPELRTGSCQAAMEHAASVGALLPIGSEPREDDTGYSVDEHGHAHHTFLVGPVANDGRMATGEGNSNDDGSSNGDRVAIRDLDHPKVRNWRTGRYRFARWGVSPPLSLDT